MSDGPRGGGRTTTTASGVESIARGEITPELLTEKQSAAMCGCGRRTWWRWTRSGLAPPPIKIGIGPRAAVRFRRADLVAWIDGGCRPPETKEGGGP